MCRLIQTVFVVTVLVAGYHCNVPNVGEMLGKPQEYAMSPAQWQSIESTFELYKKSITSMQISLKKLKKNKTVKEILSLINANLGYFQNWIRGLKQLDDSTVSYVAGISNAWTQLLREDAEHIQLFDASKLTALENSIRGDEKLAIDQLQLVNHVGSLLLEGMGNRKEEVDNFDTHLQFGDGYMSSLDAILNNIDLTFTLNYQRNVEMQNHFKDLKAAKEEMKKILDELYKALVVKNKND
ncbi:uncharacterized protein LOC116343252 [Contarinia nasturtii]|uniref:uncharacterized protein LOC116343252 n=1 Tax=Contarinia nasturtii TaxID=265458 RepID=UPI0012D47004|nr:uncharacterized protein LOC116343252 [Contarinia nasturtii]